MRAGEARGSVSGAASGASRGGGSVRMAGVAAGTASAVRVNTKQLWKSLSGTTTNPSNCLVGVARGLGHVELVYRYDRQAVNGNEAVGLMVRMPVEEEDEVLFD